MNLKRGFFSKKGQVTIFIIIAILVVAAGVIIYYFLPQIRNTTNLQEQNPYSFFQNCIEDKVKDTVDLLSLQGGYLDPNFYYNYKGDKLQYLCYAKEYLKLCVVQQPMIVQHIESEILNEIKDDVDFCFDSLDTSYKDKGYETNLERGETLVEILPNRLSLTFDTKFTATKQDTNTYNAFDINLDSNLYEITSVASSIINWETTYGDSNPSTYMNYYQNLKVEKLKQVDGTTVYIITDRNTGEKFQFVSRSLVFPPGYAA